MPILILITMIAQGKLADPPRPSVSNPVVNHTAPADDMARRIEFRLQAIEEKLNATQEAVASNQKALNDSIARFSDAADKLTVAATNLASIRPDVTPRPPATPLAPERMYVARDAAGYDFADSDHQRLLDWIEQRNLKTRKTRRISNAVASTETEAPAPTTTVRTYTAPTTYARTYTAPAVTYAAPAVYATTYAAPRFPGIFGGFSASACGAGGCR